MADIRVPSSNVCLWPCAGPPPRQQTNRTLFQNSHETILRTIPPVHIHNFWIQVNSTPTAKDMLHTRSCVKGRIWHCSHVWCATPGTLSIATWQNQNYGYRAQGLAGVVLRGNVHFKVLQQSAHFQLILATLNSSVLSTAIITTTTLISTGKYYDYHIHAYEELGNIIIIKARWSCTC